MDRHYKNQIFNRTKIYKIHKGYCFLLFAKKFGDKYGKILIHVTETGIDVAKTSSKRVVQKTAEIQEILLEIK